MSDAPKAAPLATIAAIPPLPEGWQVVSYSILRDGSLAVIGTNADLKAASRPSEVDGFKKLFELAAKAEARLWMFDGIELAAGPTFPMLEPLLIIDRFPDGRWIVVSPRTRGEANARILSPEGALLAALFLGDGIEHVKVDDLGRIWVGWFDEGIFRMNDDAWHGRLATLERAPNSFGLAAFDDGGAVLVVARSNPQEYIADCYALNVSGEAAWACLY